jgi:hypothetical protein
VIDLNDPVTAYVTDLDLEDNFGSASSIGQLLTHTSGYQDNVVRSHSPDLESDETLGEVLRADLPPRAFPPGLVSAYSDWNFSLLGYAIEGVTDKSYEIVMEDLLFKPMGMKNTTYRQPLPDEIYKNLAVGYGWDYSKHRFNTVPYDFARMSPGIALVTNGEDMGAFMSMLLNNGALNDDQILDDESLAMLLERQGGAHPYSRGWSYGFVENTIAGRKVMYKDGNGIGFSSRVVLIPDQDLGIFVSTNHRNLGEGLWPTEAAMMVTRSLLSQFMEKFVPEIDIKTPDVTFLDIDTPHNNQFAGHYQKASIARNDFFKLEGLLDNVDVKDTGNGTLQIGSGIYRQIEPLVFQNIEIPTLFVVFVESKSGEVEFLTFGGTGSYQKVPWFQTKNTQLILLAAITLISLAMVISWPIFRQGHRLIWAVSVLNTCFIGGVALLFISSVTDMLVFFKTIPIGVQILFTLPWLIGLLSLSLPVILVLAWNDTNVPWWGRLHIILLTLSSYTLVWAANFWNLILK